MESEIIELIDKFLRRDISIEEKARLRKFLIRNDISEALFSYHYDNRWRDAIENPNVPEYESRRRVWKQIENETRQNPLKHEKWKNISLKVVAIAAVIVLSVVLGFELNTITQRTAQKELIVNVENGQKAYIRLPDGSSAWLNSSSEIRYSPKFGKKNRTVMLSGEAYFEVKSDLRNPFIVQTWNGLEVKAHGTKFNVKSYKSDNEITGTLLEGKIDMNRNSFYEALHPGERIVFNTVNNTFQKSRVAHRDEAIFWLTNQFVFNGETLGNIAKILERMYNVKFVFTSPELKTIRYTGKISNNSLENVLTLITTVSPLRYTMDNSIILFNHK